MRNTNNYNYTEEMLKEKILSWPVIIIALMFFPFPIGIGLFVYKLIMNKKASQKYKSNYEKNYSKILFIIIAVFIFTNSFSILGFAKFMMLPFIIFFGVMLSTTQQKFDSNNRRLQNLYNIYYVALEDGKIRNLEKLALVRGINVEQVIAELNDLIGAGMLDDYYINYSTRTIIKQFEDVQENVRSDFEQNRTKRYKLVACKSCGARQKVDVDDVDVCAYCQSPLD